MSSDCGWRSWVMGYMRPRKSRKWGNQICSRSANSRAMSSLWMNENRRPFMRALSPWMLDSSTFQSAFCWSSMASHSSSVFRGTSMSSR